MNAPIKPLQWSEHRKPDEIIRYDHVLAESPIGLFSIEWKSWKEHDSYAVYLDSEYIAVGNDIADAMLIAERRVAEVADNLIDLSSLATVTAQRDQLQTLSVTNVMLDIVPGMDGMGEEVYAKSVEEVSHALGELACQVDDLQDQLAPLRSQAMRLRYLESVLCVPGQTYIALHQCNTQALVPEKVTAVVDQRDRLLAALIAVVAVADRKTDVFDEAHAAIASVKGGAV